VHSVLNPGGMFILEAQPWDSYRNARKIDEKFKDRIHTLELRPDDFPGLLASIGFGSPERMGEGGEGGQSCFGIHLFILHRLRR
jgi:7SK snRNA methylphosphate capping enzyme